MDNTAADCVQPLPPVACQQPDGVRHGRGGVIAFPGRPVNAGAATARDRGTAAVIRMDLLFGATDRAALAAWAAERGHGYDRVEIEHASQDDGTRASYALIYMPGQAWATWGVTRRDGQVEVWRCATGQTAGRYPRMADALASLPRVADAACPARERRVVRVTRRHEPGTAGSPPPG